MIDMGLVLEGGGLRGFYTAGVLDALLELDIRFAYVNGVSAGACNATAYLARQHGRNLQILERFVSDPRYVSYQNLLRYGSVFGMQFIFDEIPNRLLPFDYDTFFSDPTRFEFVVTCMETGEAEYLDKEALREDLTPLVASSSIPVVSRPVHWHGKHYMDGAMADSIPLQRAIDQGYARNVVVLTQPRGYVRKPQGFARYTRLRYRHYPAFIHTVETRHERYNATLQQIRELEAQGQLLVIAPEQPAPFGAYERDIDKIRSFYQAGHDDVLRRKEELEQFLMLGGEASSQRS